MFTGAPVRWLGLSHWPWCAPQEQLLTPHPPYRVAQCIGSQARQQLALLRCSAARCLAGWPQYRLQSAISTPMSKPWAWFPISRQCCPRHSLVTHFPQWTECYSTLVMFLSIQYPDKTPHFMAYLRTITHTSRNFEGEVWALYDTA